MSLPSSSFDPATETCWVCKSPRIAPYHEDFRGIRIFRCRDCGLQFINPVYTDDHLRDYYSHYTSTTVSPALEEAELYCHAFYLSLVERFNPGRGRLLDVGTGSGLMLKAARARGWECAGYDVDPATVQKVAENMQVEVRTGTFTELTWPQRFHLITLHHILEHVKNPGAYLDTILGLLEPGGALLLVLPNVNSVSSALKRQLERFGLRKEHKGAYYDTPHHICYFTPVTLKRFLRDRGWEVLYLRSGHQARPHQGRLSRWIMRHVTERIPWKSTMLVIARKPAGAPPPARASSNEGPRNLVHTI